MTKRASDKPQKPLAREHAQYGQFTVISIIVPLLGLILGVIFLSRKDPLDRKLGEHSLATSLVFGIVWTVVLGFISPFRAFYNTSISAPAPITTVTAPPAPTNPQTTLGSSLTLDGSQVTIQKVIDPITTQIAASDASTRFIAVQLQITNGTAATLTGNANINVTVMRSDNQSAEIGFNVADECTNFNSGQYTLSPGSSATGCVLFEIPNGLTAAKIQYNFNGGYSGQTGEWLVK